MRNSFILFIALIVCFSFGCKKKSGPAGSEYTSKMGGTRLWNINYLTNVCPIAGRNIDTFYQDSLTIQIVNNTTVILGSINLSFASSNSAENTTTFTHYGTGQDVDTLVYNYSANSIFFYEFRHISVCDQETYIMHTP